MIKYAATAKGLAKARQKRLVITAPTMGYGMILQYVAFRKTPSSFREILKGTQPHSRLGKLFNLFGGSGTTPSTVKWGLQWWIDDGSIRKVR